MQYLINLIAGITTWEVALGLAFAGLLALFLLPVYVLNCTGRNLLSKNVGRVAHREWLLGPYVVTYSRWPYSKGWFHRRSHRLLSIFMGGVQVEVVCLARSQVPLYRQTYRAAKKA